MLMRIDELVVELGKRDIQLRACGHDLIIRGSQDVLSDSIVRELSIHKTALLSVISSEIENGTWWRPPIVITPGMVTLVRLSEEEIEAIVCSVSGGARNVQDIYPLAPLQEGILFHHLMGGEGDPYLLAAEFSFDSRERLDRYLEALQAVIDRHDILRTAVVWEGLREPVQVVWRKAVLGVEEVELDPALGDIAKQLYERFNPRQHRIDVRQAPLLRVYVAYDKEERRWLMMMLEHHLAGDHTTLEVMQEEIESH